MAILSILLVVIANVIGVVQKTWVKANSRVSQFREARMAFDAMSRTLPQATLNAYWQNEFDDLGVDVIGDKKTKAKSYVRQSELQFVCGPASVLLAGALPADYPGHAVFFQAPFGVTNMTTAVGTMVNTENMVNLLSGRGYFVSWGNDAGFRPPFLDPATVKLRYRYRLMEYSPTAELNRIYDSSLRPITDHANAWFQGARTSVATAGELAVNRGFTRPIADNVIALIISPQVENDNKAAKISTWIAPAYAYDSTVKANVVASEGEQGTQHQLPPKIKITMIAVDDAAAEIMAANPDSPNLLTEAGSSFVNVNSYAADLNRLETYLSQAPRRYNYRVYSTVVSIKQAKWSL
ncbi:hypothetical protein BH11VER1_BH11VER1_17210 [soil metagenome]